MPHTASRNKARSNRSKALHNTKLVHESGDDGWSHVVRKNDQQSSRTSSVKTSSILNENGASNLNELLTLDQAAYYDEISSHVSEKSRADCRPRQPRHNLGELTEQFERVRKACFDSGVVEQVKAVLHRAEIVAPGQDDETGGRSEESTLEQDLANLALDSHADSHHLELLRKTSTSQVRKIVCIGLGSASSDQSGWRRVVLWQLVMLLEIAKLLNTDTSTDPVKIYAQDPVFNDVDTALLSNLNINVLVTPEAFTLIDKETLVFAPHYSIVNWTAQMRQGKAACIIGNNVGAALESGRLPHPQELEHFFNDVAKRSNYSDELRIPDVEARQELEEFVRSHEMARWPEPRDGVAEGSFNDTFIYWRSAAS